MHAIIIFYNFNYFGHRFNLDIFVFYRLTSYSSSPLLRIVPVSFNYFYLNNGFMRILCEITELSQILLLYKNLKF